MKIENTIVFPIIRQDCIIPALRSLREFTPSNYRTIVVNQSKPDREFEEALYQEADYVIRTHCNLGFAQGANLGLRLSPAPYATVCNDDVIFTSSWWDGIVETFERFEAAAACNPQSPKEPGWGWAEPGFRYLIPEPYMKGDLKRLHDKDRSLMLKMKEAKMAWEEFSKRPQRDADTGKQLLARMGGRKQKFQETQDALEHRILELSYDEEYISAMTREKKWAVVDAFACWCTVFRADRLQEIGLFDEMFFPGGGEDYCWQHRCYKAGYRALSTSRSWVWHWWGRSKDSPSGFSTALPNARPHWNKLSTKGFGSEGLYDPDCSVWGEDWSTRTRTEIYRAPL